MRQLPEPQHAALAAALGLAAGEGRDRFPVSAGALSLLAAAADDGPILCVVDDAQWLDVPSADSLTFVARRLVAEGVVILFGAREGELRRLDAPGLSELMIAGLDREPALALLARSASDAADSVRERLLAAADGNPLALLELPAALSAQQLKGHATLRETLPLTARLRAAFTQRLEGLPASAREALLIAATDGAESQTREHVAELRALVATSGASSVGRHVGRALGLLDLGLGRPAEALEQQLVMISAARPESNPLFVSSARSKWGSAPASTTSARQRSSSARRTGLGKRCTHA